VSSLFPTPTFWGSRLARCVVSLLSNWVSQLASELHLHLVSPRLACRCPLHCTTPAPGILLLGLQVPTTLCCACTRHSHAQPAGTHRTAPALGITMPSLQVPTVPALGIPMLSLQVPTALHLHSALPCPACRCPPHRTCTRHHNAQPAGAHCACTRHSHAQPAGAHHTALPVLQHAAHLFHSAPQHS
jgi:hypothetical protein